MLREVLCFLQLREPLRGSVAGWLARLGVQSQDASAAALQPGQGGFAVRVSELGANAGQPGPELVLTPLNERGSLSGGRSVAAPVLGCSLGPALLGMVLEWLWVRDDRRDSVP